MYKILSRRELTNKRNYEVFSIWSPKSNSREDLPGKMESSKNAGILIGFPPFLSSDFYSSTDSTQSIFLLPHCERHLRILPLLVVGSSGCQRKLVPKFLPHLWLRLLLFFFFIPLLPSCCDITSFQVLKNLLIQRSAMKWSHYAEWERLV